MNLSSRSILTNAKKRLVNMESENWGGVAGVAGNLVVLLGVGDVQSVASTFLFTAGRVILAKAGEQTPGYSAGIGLASLGCLSLVLSETGKGNLPLKFTIAAMALNLGIGATRYPLEKIARRIARKHPQLSARMLSCSKKIKPVVGTTALVLNAPGLVSALVGRDVIMVTAMSFWTASHFLCGKLQDTIRPAYSKIKRVLNHRPTSPPSA